MDDLLRLRDYVDEIDAVIVRLLGVRAWTVVQIGELKRAQNIAVSLPAREAQVLEKVKEISAEGHLSPDAAVRIFEQIITECKMLEQHYYAVGHSSGQEV